MSSERRTVALGLRLLLAAYPATFRREFGDEILAFWLAQRSEPRYRRPLGVWRYWHEVIHDALTHGTRARWSGGRPPSLRPQQPATRPPHDRGFAMSSVLTDLRYSIRFLRAAPLFSTVALLTLILGIGTNTAIFSIVNGVLLRPLPYADPTELVAVWRSTPGLSTVSVALPEFQALRERARTFDSVTATIEGTTGVQWPGEARQQRIARVSAGYFDVFGVRPVLGRAFSAEEDSRGGPRVAIISGQLWRDRFGSDPEVLQHTVTIGQQAHAIVGVLERGPEHPLPGTDIWLPLQEAQLMVDLGMNPDTRDLVYLTVYGRLTGGATVDAASAEVSGIMEQLNEADGREIDSIGGWAQPLHEATVGASRSALLLVLGAVGLLLAIVCANVAGLWLTRVTARTREVAIRSAIGAGRARVLRQLLTESLVLALAGGAGGVLLARGLTGYLMALAPSSLPRHASVVVDGGVVLYAGLLTLGSGLLFGLLPALRAARLDPAVTLRGAGRSGRGSSGRGLQRALVVAQVAVSVVLLSGAMLLANSYLRLVWVDPGFEPDRVLTTQLSAPFQDADTNAVRSFYRRLLERVRALPGVASASITYSPPMAQSNFRQTVEAEDRAVGPDEERPWAGTVIIGTDYFETVGVPLQRGRDFTLSDRLGDEPVAIANEAMAALLWPGEDPLGKRFRITGGISGSADSFESEFFPDDWIAVVGVAADVRRRDLGQQAVPEFYRPHAQMSWPSAYLVVKAERASTASAAQIRETVWQIDPSVPVETVQSLGGLLSSSVAEPRFRLVLLGSFAAAACFLAMLGVYAVMTMTVAGHTHEIGVRMALGAPRTLVLRAVLLDGFKLAAWGLGIGLLGALAGGRLLATMLYSVTPSDPATHALVAVATLAVALAACYVPARRAARLDPTRALRDD